MNDRMTFYGATDLEARRRALRFQAENLDYVLTAVDSISNQSTLLGPAYAITVHVRRLYNMDVDSTISDIRTILTERATVVLRLPKEEALAYADCDDDLDKDDDLPRPTVHLTLAERESTARVDNHDITGARLEVLRDTARLAGWKYARHQLANLPATTLLWADGVEGEMYDRVATEAPRRRRPVKAEVYIARHSVYRVDYDNGSHEVDNDHEDYTAYTALRQVSRLMGWRCTRRQHIDGQPDATEVCAPGRLDTSSWSIEQLEEGAGVAW
jgi:hypothetical protein